MPSTRAGAEALVHTLQARSQADPTLTVLSVDAAAAYDVVSREAMLAALRDEPSVQAVLPFARMWYARESRYVWAAGDRSHCILQAEGGEQGDPLMPAMFSLALRPALRALQSELQPGEQALAYLDDIYILAPPSRVAELYRRLEQHLLRHAHLRLKASKSKVWSCAGLLPPGVHALAPDSPIWVGDPALPPAERGIVALGVPVVTPEFIEAHLHTVLARQASLLDTLPALHDSQVAWLLLSYCAVPRAQYAIRTLPLHSTQAYAAGHDTAVLRCLSALLSADAASGLLPPAQTRAQLALRHGGLGLRSATRHAPAAYWASWADALRAVSRRDAPFARNIVGSLASDRPLPEALESLRVARNSLAAIGFEPPIWEELLQAEAPSQPEEDPSLDLTRGWQRPASQAVDDFCHRAFVRETDAASAALLESQAGPHAARVLTARPTQPEFTLASPGLLRARGGPVERAAARICREAGATVALNVLVRDLNVNPVRQDDRRIQVIANGLPLWGGAQLAVDTTLVSPLTAAGAPRRAGGRTTGAALLAARRAKERTYPELCRSSRCRLTVLAIEVGGRWSAEAATFVRQLARCEASSTPPPSRAAAISAFTLRWSALLSFAAARSFAASLLSLPLTGTANVDGELPPLSDMLADSASLPPLASRLV